MFDPESDEAQMSEEEDPFSHVKPLWDPDEAIDPEFLAFEEEMIAEGMIPPTIRGPTGGSSNTGPKGVKADYEVAKVRAELHMLYENQLAMKSIKEGSYIVSTVQEDLENDENFKKWLEEREAEKNKTYEFVRETATRYGQFMRFGRADFVSFIDDEKKHVNIVIHLFQPFKRECVRLNDILEDLAKKYPYTKFGAILSNDTGGTTDRFRDGIPAILVYSGSADKPHQIHLRIDEDLPEYFDIDDVESFFIRNTIVNPQHADPTYDD
eukprot:TRINITY_DN9553_c0_g1_i1.p1 TRINITY_DN9553_c0_g1~~TRINITY_DN9553_c0_g1_i1.p1  ORF type:complete len:267 (-),score=75.19 TRINITY_DN9553_c0_g1_i1:33-833(-)